MHYDLETANRENIKNFMVELLIVEAANSRSVNFSNIVVLSWQHADFLISL